MIAVDNPAAFSDLFKILPLEEIQALFARTQEKTVNSSEIYIKQGEFSQKPAFIKKGIIRTYTVKDNGEESTLLLRWEEQFIGSHDSILLSQPSKYFYPALEKTTILEIDYNTVNKIMQQNPAYEPLRVFVLRTKLAGTLGMIENFILLNPEERYRKLVANYPDIVNRVPGKYIASMLGITPVSLSRIRRRITGK